MEGPYSSLNPRLQKVTFHMANGAPFYVPLEYLDIYSADNVKCGINFGAQLGATIVTLVVFLFTSKPEKRRTVLFALNMTSLLLCIAELICTSRYYTSRWTEIYSVLTGDVSQIPQSDYALSVLPDIFHLLLIGCVESSFIIQCNALCGALRRRYRIALLCLMCCMAVVTLAFDLWLTVVNIIHIMKHKPMRGFSSQALVASIVLNIFTALFTLASLVKLGRAMLARRKMGMRQFGPTRVLFIVTFESMLLVGKFLYLSLLLLLERKILLFLFLFLSFLFSSLSLLFSSLLFSSLLFSSLLFLSFFF